MRAENDYIISPSKSKKIRMPCIYFFTCVIFHACGKIIFAEMLYKREKA